MRRPGPGQGSRDQARPRLGSSLQIYLQGGEQKIRDIYCVQIGFPAVGRRSAAAAATAQFLLNTLSKYPNLRNLPPLVVGLLFF